MQHPDHQARQLACSYTDAGAGQTIYDSKAGSPSKRSGGLADMQARSYSSESVRSLDEHNAIVRKARPRLRKLFASYSKKTGEGLSSAGWWSSSEDGELDGLATREGVTRSLPRRFGRSRGTAERQCGAGVDEVVIRKVDDTLAYTGGIVELEGCCEFRRRDTTAPWRSIRQAWKERKDGAVSTWRAAGASTGFDESGFGVNQGPRTWWSRRGSETSEEEQERRQHRDVATLFNADVGLFRVHDERPCRILRRPVGPELSASWASFDGDSQTTEDTPVHENEGFASETWRLLTSQLPPVVLRRPSQAARPHKKKSERHKVSLQRFDALEEIQAGEEPLWCRLAMILYALAITTIWRIWKFELRIFKTASIPSAASLSPEAARIHRACMLVSAAGRLVILLYALLCTLHVIRGLFGVFGFFLNPGRVAWGFVKWMLS